MILIRALRFAFHLLYYQFAWTYDFVAAAVSGGKWVRWVRTMVPELAFAEKILEIGHGPGHLMAAMMAEGKSPVGVDLSPQMGRRARRLLLRLHTPGSAGSKRRRAAQQTVPEAGAAQQENMPRLVRCDARFLPFPAAHFDAVVATFPAEYIAEEAAWISLQRVLQPGGRILILLGAIPTGKGLWAWFSRQLFRLTGQAGKDEIIRLRTRFTEFFDRIGLEAELRIENKESSELIYLTVRGISHGLHG